LIDNDFPAPERDSGSRFRDNK